MKILFIQHATDIGGSALSLRVVIEDGIEAGWIPYLIVRNETIRAYYREILPDTQIFVVPRLTTFDHHSAHIFGASPREVARVFYRLLLLLRVAPELRRIIRQIQPATIHLNSSVLIPFLPVLAGSAGRFGVHIRERVAGGWRNRLFCHLLEKYADYCIFISPVEQQLLPAKTRHLAVIYNYIKPPKSLTGQPTTATRERGKLTLLSLGGTSRIKGIDELLTLAKSFPDAIQIRIVGSTHEAIEQGIPSNVQILPATPHPLEEIALCDFLVFWTHQPHFPRPVYEAWLLKKPCIVSQCMQSQGDVDRFSAILGQGDNAADLIAVVENILTNMPDLKEIVEHAFHIAHNKFGPGNFRKLKDIIEINQNIEGRNGHVET